jgi:hypothetical protein
MNFFKEYFLKRKQFQGFVHGSQNWIESFELEW